MLPPPSLRSTSTRRRWTKPQKWYEKLIAVDPQNKEAYYTLGVIAWTKWLSGRTEARAKLGMKPEDPGPIKDKKIREELKAKYGPMIDDGIKYAREGLEIDPEYDDAMAYMNLLIRERADLDEHSGRVQEGQRSWPTTGSRRRWPTKKDQGRTRKPSRRGITTEQ